jgi:putative transposase
VIVSFHPKLSPLSCERSGYAVKKDTIVELGKTTYSDDPLTEILRRGAKKLLTQAIEIEVEQFLKRHRDIQDEEGRRMIVRNGYLPERDVQTGIGSVSVRCPRVRDRRSMDLAERIHFSSSILPPYLRRTKSLEELIPWLYLKGVSTGDFSEALAALVGKDAPGLSSSTIGRLKRIWKEEYSTWRSRDLTGKRYLYFWVDGIYMHVRMEEAKTCLLVVIGATQDGKKELIAIEDGYRESEQSWRELKWGPKLAIGDGALGFWKAFGKIYGQSRWQRCWVHKTANVLNKLPKSLQKKAKDQLHQIWMADRKDAAYQAFDHFIETYEAKYPKATECLERDREELLAFYDFPAEHWAHIRTTNPIESTFATVKLRTAKTRGCVSRETALTMVFQLCRSAERKWRRLNSPNRCMEVIDGINFIDGVKQERKAA